MVSYSPMGDTRQGSGVMPVSPQDTSTAAAQAKQNQEPGSEFNPLPNPDVEKLTKRLDELEKLCTSYYDKMWNTKSITWKERDELHEQINAVDVERAGIRTQLSSIYEASEYPRSVEPDYKSGPFTGDATVIGEDSKPKV